jgi:hypothetical protein
VHSWGPSCPGTEPTLRPVWVGSLTMVAFAATACLTLSTWTCCPERSREATVETVLESATRQGMLAYEGNDIWSEA